MLRACLLAFALVLPLPAAAQTAAPLDREALRAEIRAYLLENPEVIYEAIEILEQRRRVAAQVAELALVRANADALRNDGYSHVAGNPDGALTIVEFFDYACGYCKRAHPDIVTLLRTDGDIRLVMKEFPILGPGSVLASRAAMAALRQDPQKYAGFSDALMAFGGQFTDTVIDGLAARAGLDVARLRADMAAPEIDAEIAQTRALAETLQISGTPTFIVGDKILRGYLPLDDLRQVVAAARAAQD